MTDTPTTPQSPPADAALPTDLKYTIYASVTGGADGAVLWDANARKRDGTCVAGASGDTPAAALDALTREIITNG